MLAALMMMLSLAQAGEGWRPLPSPEVAALAWRLAADDAGGGDARRAVMRMEGPELVWPAAEMNLQFACADPTVTIVAARGFDEAGALVRTVQPLPEQLRPEPIHADDGAYAAIYAHLCPGAAPLPERPNHPPPVIVPVPRD